MGLGYVASIVEGHGEIEAVPILLHRIAQAAAPGQVLRVNPPIRVRAGSFLNDNAYLHKYVSLAAAKAVPERGLVLILLDCDDDCPARLGPSILGRVQAVREDVSYLVALADREYESWFLAAARSLRGVRGLPDDLIAPQNAASIRDAKGWLTQRMANQYDPITHQPELSRRFDLAQARDNRSFDRLYSRLAADLTRDTPAS